MAAVCRHALAHATKRPWPASFTTHFLRPTVADADAIINVEIVRAGRTRTLAVATLSQQDSTRVRCSAWMSEPFEPNFLEHTDPTLEAPDIPPPQDCPPRQSVAQGLSLPILDSLDIRVHPDFVADGEAGGGPAANLEGWIRFGDGRPPDVASLGLFCDAFPPPVFALMGTGIGWVPTLELTTHVRRRPAPGWIQARLRSADITADHVVESGELWDQDGHLVAQSRQLALLLRR